jgi:hypothetical protein
MMKRILMNIVVLISSVQAFAKLSDELTKLIDAIEVLDKTENAAKDAESRKIAAKEHAAKLMTIIPYMAEIKQEIGERCTPAILESCGPDSMKQPSGCRDCMTLVAIVLEAAFKAKDDALIKEAKENFTRYMVPITSRGLQSKDATLSKDTADKQAAMSVQFMLMMMEMIANMANK